MSFSETDREDLMREATALQCRVQFRVPGDPTPIVAGFRRDGSLSLYFGGDPAYHFDDETRLRRAFCDGLLYRTQGSTLARLRRVRTGGTTELQRHDLSPAELSRFLDDATNRAETVCAAIRNHAIELMEVVPENENPLPKIAAHLERFRESPDTLAPQISGKQ